jgi:gamma-D-glutamyl-L-lysine dipeptidyl-peptidase
MPQYGFCHLSCIPVRADASEKSEMINQFLFGETFEIIDQFKGWKIVRGLLDNYEGFIDKHQFVEISSDRFQLYHKNKKLFPADIISTMSKSTGGHVWLSPACSLELLDRDMKIATGKSELAYSGKVVSPPSAPVGNDIVAASMKYLNAPYLWGGRSIFGIDCSGLVQNAFKINGIALPRDASQQVKIGETVFLISEALPGDLAFFENDLGEIVHVGVLISQSEIIHASGCVKIDDVDHHGIFNRNTKNYSHKLRIIKRILTGERLA